MCLSNIGVIGKRDFTSWPTQNIFNNRREWPNDENEEMTVKQEALKLVYPLIKRIAKWRNAGTDISSNVNNKEPLVSFYSLSATLISEEPFDFAELKGKKVLLVNVASECGYTPQYEELELLKNLYKDELIILAFPANDFKEQEPGDDMQIETFCKINYGVTFRLFKKHPVRGTFRQEVFHWLSQKDQNGWNDQQPSWNFCKYLVDSNGTLQYFFAPYIFPLGKEITRAVNSIR